MPMPIPNPTTVVGIVADLHNMSFADAHVLPFTNMHQPSLATTSTRLANATKKKDIAASKVGAARVASSLSHTITKLKNRTAF